MHGGLIKLKRQVFFSFHFENDIWRTAQIRNIGEIEGQRLFSDNGWEKVRLKNEDAIKRWIDKELDMRSCIVVLIGEETASRHWVQYEIQEAWTRGKGVLGIYINGLKDSLGQTSKKGKNPLELFCIDKTMNYIAKRSDPLDEDELNLADVCITFESNYSFSKNIFQDITENITDLIEKSIEIRNRYPK